MALRAALAQPDSLPLLCWQVWTDGQMDGQQERVELEQGPTAQASDSDWEEWKRLPRRGGGLGRPPGQATGASACGVERITEGRQALRQPSAQGDAKVCTLYSSKGGKRGRHLPSCLAASASPWPSGNARQLHPELEMSNPGLWGWARSAPLVTGRLAQTPNKLQRLEQSACP